MNRCATLFYLSIRYVSHLIGRKETFIFDPAGYWIALRGLLSLADVDVAVSHASNAAP